MFEYYDARAGEYEEIFTLGHDPARTADSKAYRPEVEILSEIVRRVCRGRIVDIGCGTGFWLPHYASSATRVTVVDQSPNMIALCEEKIRGLDLEGKTTVLRGDFFDQNWGFNRSGFNSPKLASYLQF